MGQLNGLAKSSCAVSVCAARGSAAVQTTANTTRWKVQGCGRFFMAIRELLRLQFSGDVLTAHLDFAFVPADLCEVVRHLHPQPRFRRAAERL
jgi:hypothetical protein